MMNWTSQYGVSTAALANGAITISVEWTSDGFKVIVHSYHTHVLKTRHATETEAKRAGIDHVKRMMAAVAKQIEAAK